MAEVSISFRPDRIHDELTGIPRSNCVAEAESNSVADDDDTGHAFEADLFEAINGIRKTDATSNDHAEHHHAKSECQSAPVDAMGGADTPGDQTRCREHTSHG